MTPSILVRKYSHAIAIAIDLARLGLLFSALRLIGIEEPSAYAAAGLLYTTTPILVTYNLQLNPRGLGALMLDAVLLLGMQVATGGLTLSSDMSTLGMGLLMALLFGLILLTHKMTTQLFVFLTVWMAAWLSDWRLLLLVPAGGFIALLLSGGFYFKILVAHWDIVKFWSREWPRIGADPLKESEVYPDVNHEAQRAYEPGIKNMLKRFGSILVGNYAPAAVGALVVVLVAPFEHPQLGWLTAWLAGCVAFSILTTLVPFLRGLGFGNLYLYNAAFPACLCLGLATTSVPETAWLFVALLTILNLVILVRSLRHLSRRKDWGLPAEICEAIAQSEPGTWISFPMQLMEQIAYLCNKPVLWGAHGYVFEHVALVFPVLQKDFAYFKSQYGLRFILVDTAHLPDIEKSSLPYHIRLGAAGYHIVELI